MQICILPIKTLARKLRRIACVRTYIALSVVYLLYVASSYSSTVVVVVATFFVLINCTPFSFSTGHISTTM